MVGGFVVREGVGVKIRVVGDGVVLAPAIEDGVTDGPSRIKVAGIVATIW
jgi:hypothetical protein